MTSSDRGPGTAPALALVHHGHQYLITDGYDNHEGLSDILESFGAVLALHLRYRVPLNLHLSGTLLEAAAWHAPEFFGWVDALGAEGLVEVLGSAYSQPVMTLFGTEHNRRQVAEELALVQHHLGVAPGAVSGFWVPERVWDTGVLAPLLASPDLGNGGFRYVLLDDRLAFPAAERAGFDRGTAPGRSPLPASAAGPPPGASTDAAAPPGAPPDGRHLRPWRIDGGQGLISLPISGDLRYAIPPRDRAAWRLLFGTLDAVRDAGPGALALYADDLEKTAAVGPWAGRTWCRADLDAYEGLLRWLAGTYRVDTVLLGPWLAAHPPTATRTVDPGTFYELAAGGAGDDYQRWWTSAPYAPYRAHLERLEETLAAGPPVPGPVAHSSSANGSSANRSGAHPARRLWDLAWSQLMAAAYETAWHGLGAAPDEPAPWARAAASHARAALPTVAAALFSLPPSRTRDAPDPTAPRVWSSDLDDDGEAEVALANERLFAVLSPRFGGRLVALYDLDAGALVVGNPADDWNWQEDLNRYMEIPANHPGALADVGHENERWELAATRTRDGAVEAELRNVEAGSPLFGSTKRLRLRPGAAHLDVAYELADAPERFRLELGLSPDYLTLLREGRAAVRPLHAGRRRGFAAGAAAVWVELPDDQPLVWEPAPARPAGHVLVLRVAAYRPSFALRLGVGVPSPPEEIDLRVAVPGRRRSLIPVAGPR
ncbi:MAG: hypothetical protein ACRD0O_18885 [Acidimicrobiia bacterium]